MAPAPISWPPSQYWDGDDGSWSSFPLRVGSSEQPVRILPSTAGQATWVVSPQGCPPGTPGTSASSSCNHSRGGLFDATQPNSWQAFGSYSFDLEQNLDYDAAALYGLDTIALGFDEAIGGPTLDSQIVLALTTDGFYMGGFGLGRQGTNVSNFTDPHPSFLEAMRNKNLIPSLSWAYTAGAPYRSKGVFGSLTFGGYDSSRFFPNDVPFFLASDISRDLVVGLQSLSLTITDGSTTKSIGLLSSPILTFIDSTLPYIYLPIQVCQEFEHTLGLAWDDTPGMYWVNDTLHQSLLSKELNFTFTIGDSIDGGPTVQIALPYASFDLEAKNPLATNNTRYFPLQQANDESQYTLGRTFLQEAYIIVNYEQSNFSVSQCRFEDGVPADLVAIPSATEIPSHLRRNLAIGTSIGAASFLLLATFAVLFAIRRWRRKASVRPSSEATEPRISSQEPRALILSSPREIDHNSMVQHFHDLPNSARAELLNEQAPSGSGNEIFEISEPLSRKISQGPHIMVQRGTADRWRILFPTKIPRKSWTSLASSADAPRVETEVSASTQRKEGNMDKASIVTSNLEAQIISLYLGNSPDLDRSLPPTPISESLQVSPVLESFNGRSFPHRRPQTLKILTRGPGSAFTSPGIPVSKHPATSSGHKRLPVSGVLTSCENEDSDQSERRS